MRPKKDEYEGKVGIVKHLPFEWHCNKIDKMRCKKIPTI